MYVFDNLVVFQYILVWEKSRLYHTLITIHIEGGSLGKATYILNEKKEYVEQKAYRQHHTYIITEKMHKIL
jgi:hypothetical protein